MFDEYKKSQQQSRTKSFKQSFKHFPRAFRVSSKRKRAPTAIQQQKQQQTAGDEKIYKNDNDNEYKTASLDKINKEATSSLNNTINYSNITEKEKRKRLFKSKNKTLQHLRKNDDQIQKRKMPPKSISFDEVRESTRKGNKTPFYTTNINSITSQSQSDENVNKNQPAEFFIDFEDSAAKASIVGSRSGSNVSLINTTTKTITKSSKMINGDSVNGPLGNQSNHTNNNRNGSSSFSNRIYDSFKRKKSGQDNNKNIDQNKLTKQKSLCSENGTLDLDNQSDVANNTPTIADQSNGGLTHVNNRSNELVKGMNLEAYDTFV